MADKRSDSPDGNELESLRLEVKALRRAFDQLNARLDSLGAAPIKAPADGPTTKEAPTPKQTLAEPHRAKLLTCPVCSESNDLDAVYCEHCAYPLKGEPQAKPAAQAGAAASQRKPRVERPKTLIEWLQENMGRTTEGKRLPPPPPPRSTPQPYPPPQGGREQRREEMGTEQMIGEKVLNYVGLTLIVLGAVFFMLWQVQRMGAVGKVAMGLGVGGLLALAGEQFRVRPLTRKFGLPFIGAGWAIAFYTLYAAHHVVVPPVLHSAEESLGLMLVASAGLIVHARFQRNRTFLAYAFGLIYLSFWIGHAGTATLDAALLVTAAALYIGTYGRAPQVLPVAVLGFYLNYSATYFEIMSVVGRDQRSLFLPDRFVTATALLIAGGLMPFAAAFLPGPRRQLFRGPVKGLTDASLCLSAVLCGFLVYSQGASYLLGHHFALGLSVAAVMATLAVAAWAYFPKELALQQFLPFLATAFLALGSAYIHDPVRRMWAWTLASAFWTALGLLAAQPYFRAMGGLTAVFIPAFYWYCRSSLPPDRQSGLSLPLYLYSALAYAYGWLRAQIPNATEQEWEKRGEEIWFFLATAFLAMGLWTALDPAPFAVALAALALLLETIAVSAERPALWAQAAWLAPAAGLYTFFIAYGTESRIAGLFSPRVLTAGCVAGVLGYLRYFDPLPEDFAAPLNRAAQRRLLGWLAMAILAYTGHVEHMIGPRLKMPVHAVLAVGAYLLGKDWKDRDLRLQGYAVAVLAALEGLFNYVFFPPAMLEPLTHLETALYWGSAFSLLAPMVAPVREDEGGSRDEAVVPLAFTFISLGLLAAFIYKESQGSSVTLGWSLLGAAWLVGGIVLDLVPLRYPGLALLTLCVAKALVIDMAAMELPYRVASYMVLGLMLVAASYLYVSHGQGKKPGGPG